MAVHKYVSKTGVTTYKASYLGPDGRRRVEIVRTLKAGANEKAHADAEAAARVMAHDQRRNVKNKEWKDPHAKKAAPITFAKLAEKFLEAHTKDHYKWRAKVATDYFGKNLVNTITTADVEKFKLAREGARGRVPGTKASPSTIR